jgi:hypothetical protein
VNPRSLARFRVGGFDDEGDNDAPGTEPVRVTCTRCRSGSPWMEFRDGGADRTAGLDELVVWAQEHRCPVVRTATPREMAEAVTAGA